MPIRPAPTIRPSEITAERYFHMRRELLTGALGLAAAAIAPRLASGAAAAPAAALKYSRNARYSTTEKPNTFEEVTTYNNFYEFGLEKSDPAANAGTLRTRPWTVTIAGEAAVTGTFNIEDILKPHPLEERIYRHRCVEAWSMVIPWLGFPLADLVKKLAPTSRAKYVRFTTLLDPEQLPNQESHVLSWPYVEGLRIDEATNPLAFLALGLYGAPLPGQNGAPLRLVVPWKYGFKGGKSLVEIRFQEHEPETTWSRSAPSEYGFYANVNPAVDHPRWSQATERRIGELSRRKTLPFNGYAEHVAALYRGMDLARYF